jgi:hypothetical protein
MGTWIQLTYNYWWFMGLCYGRAETRTIMTKEKG